MKTTLCLLASFVSLSMPARADRPLVSETADVIPSGDCQVETAAARVTSRGALSTTGLNALFSCGVLGNHQAALGYGDARSGGRSEQSLYVGGKSTLIAPAAGVTGLGVGYGIGLLKSAGLSFDHESSMVVAVLTRELSAGLLGHVNLGWSRSQSARQNSALWSLGFEHGSDRVFAADLFGDDRGKPWLSAGMGWSLADKLSVNLAGALQFEKPKVKNLSVGFKIIY